MASGVVMSIDRICDLPDAILCHILSFLPTKYAVGTSILSKRWRHVWASVPVVDFDDTLFLQDQDWSQMTEDKSYDLELSFMNCVTRVLLLSDLPCFRKFRLVLERYYWNMELVDVWICAAIKHNVKELHIEYYSKSGTSLPRLLFTSQTLVFLLLCCGILLNVPDTVLLPSLKVIHLLSVIYENEDSTQKLLSGCPIIEELLIERTMFDPIRNISAPTLKSFTITHREVFPVIEDEWEDPDWLDEQISGSKLMVSCPNLVHFHIKDYVSDVFVVKGASFSKAYVDVGRIYPKHSEFNSYSSLMTKLLDGIANVKFLTLTSNTIAFLSKGCECRLPTFDNMIQLEFGADADSGWHLLADFLGCSANLEVLILDEGPRLPDTSVCWTPPHEMPSCLLHLKEIEVKELCGAEYELDGMEYLLKNAKVLKKMTINCRHLDPNEKLKFCDKLSSIPRDSVASQLEFLS